MKFALFLPNWVGDAVMATPALHALRRRFPEAECVGIARPVIAETLAASGLLDRVLPYHPRGADPTRRGWRFLGELRAAKCDTAILFPNSLRSAWWAWLSGAKRRVGFDRDLRGWLLTDRVPPKSKTVPHPVLDEYNRLAMALGCEDPGTKMRLGVTAEDQARLDRFWTKQPQGLRERGVVVFNSGGAFGPAKNWPRESFASLARKVVDELGQTVLVVCGPAEREEARWIATQAQRSNVLSLADEPLSVGLTKAAIRAADLLVTTDSGPRHFAAPFGVPTVTLYGPTHIAWSDTHDPRAIALQIAVDCGPCQQRTCPQGHHRCMRELPVDLVFDAVRRQLEPVTRRVA
jgi:heptosyltransferase-2